MDSDVVIEPITTSTNKKQNEERRESENSDNVETVKENGEETVKPAIKLTQTFKLNDANLNENVIEFLATELGQEWLKLARCLNVKKARVQAIIGSHNNNSNKTTATDMSSLDNTAAKYEMLMTWAKRQPRSVNKVNTVKQQSRVNNLFLYKNYNLNHK